MESFLFKLVKFNAYSATCPTTESPSSYFGIDGGYKSTVSFAHFVTLQQILSQTHKGGDLISSAAVSELLNVTEFELSDMAYDVNLGYEITVYIQTLPWWKQFPFIFGFFPWRNCMFSGKVELGWTTGQHDETYQAQTNPRNPNPWESVQRTDLQGAPHFNKGTGKCEPTPHVHDPTTPGGVRPARPDEIPGGG